LRQLFICLSPHPPVTNCTNLRIHNHTGGGGSGRDNRGEYRLQSRVENTIMTECTQEIGYLQSINSLCVGLKELTLITFWNKLFEYGDSSIVVCTTLNTLWLGSKLCKSDLPRNRGILLHCTLPPQSYQLLSRFYASSTVEKIRLIENKSVAWSIYTTISLWGCYCSLLLQQMSEIGKQYIFRNRHFLIGRDQIFFVDLSELIHPGLASTLLQKNAASSRGGSFKEIEHSRLIAKLSRLRYSRLRFVLAIAGHRGLGVHDRPVCTAG
jgi:hypothetical protein